MFEREKHCGACGKPFECGGLLFCWCRGVSLDAAVREQLRSRYNDCLCPACLEGFAKDANGSAARQPTT